MPRYQVKYGPKAQNDLQASYDWGVKNWGTKKADEWVLKLDELIEKRLSNIPLACPLAPESKDYDFEIRHLVIHRYRILFRVVQNTVTILRIRGPFSGPSLELR